MEHVLLNFLLSNCTWEDGEVIATFRQPFDLLAEIAVSAGRAAADGTGGLTKTEIWLCRQSAANSSPNCNFPVRREETGNFSKIGRFWAIDVAKTRSGSVRYRRNSLWAGTGNFFDPSREYQGNIRDLKRLNSRFLGPRMRHRVRSQNLGVRVGIGSATPMRCQCNKIRLAPASWANQLTIGQALASVGAPHSACPSGFLSPRSRSPGIACRMFNTSRAKVPQIRIDALPQRFRLLVGSLAHGSATAAMELQQRIRHRRSR